MEEKMLISAKTKISSAIGPIVCMMIGGVFLMATCLVWETIVGDWGIFVSAGIGGFMVFMGIIYIILIIANHSGAGLYVTDKRVYGKTVFGVRIDIPIDSVSAVSLVSSGISVSSSSGRINFAYLDEKNEVFRVLSELIIRRQNERNEMINRASANNVQTQSSADELKKFKELLDMGVITQEEFDAKKKQLLGL